ncbi:hypothetical protein QM716_15100 [Rhodococcus sp. IEGM 1409]|uniref:hypothetical protein n=1 Tax=Rhodococcus sp. IEGM 1409 TaxID=3047082 RepID=UPI0024B81972|nr:hypothetical protein [Rhodococcus sp. IEGM 1409]MDI9901183.1 hypothetical protein [Rhodococcus sp. IEGM 1409]
MGAQRLVEVARAMATEPDVLLLDEPFAGADHDGIAAVPFGRLLRRAREWCWSITTSISSRRSQPGSFCSISDRWRSTDRRKSACQRGDARSLFRFRLRGRCLTMLELDRVTVRYGSAIAVRDVSFTALAVVHRGICHATRRTRPRMRFRSDTGQRVQTIDGRTQRRREMIDDHA